jgi:hypothetical protein
MNEIDMNEIINEYHEILFRLYEIQLLVGKDEFDKMLKEYLQDKIKVK